MKTRISCIAIRLLHSRKKKCTKRCRFICSRSSSLQVKWCSILLNHGTMINRILLANVNSDQKVHFLTEEISPKILKSDDIGMSRNEVMWIVGGDDGFFSEVDMTDTSFDICSENGLLAAWKTVWRYLLTASHVYCFKRLCTLQ